MKASSTAEQDYPCSINKCSASETRASLNLKRVEALQLFKTCEIYSILFHPVVTKDKKRYSLLRLMQDRVCGEICSKMLKRSSREKLHVYPLAQFSLVSQALEFLCEGLIVTQQRNNISVSSNRRMLGIKKHCIDNSEQLGMIWRKC